MQIKGMYREQWRESEGESGRRSRAGAAADGDGVRDGIQHAVGEVRAAQEVEEDGGSSASSHGLHYCLQLPLSFLPLP